MEYFNSPQETGITASAVVASSISSFSNANTTDDPISSAKRLLAQHRSHPSNALFEPTRELALEYAEEILHHWLPDGELQGREYVPCNPLRYDAEPGSFKINTETGVWADFATDDSGGDLISLVAYIDEDEFQTEAAIKILEFIAGLRMDDVPMVIERIPEPKVPEKKPEWKVLMPIPENAKVRTVFFGEKLGSAAATWTYRDAQGKALFYVNRFNNAKGKSFLPQTYCEDETGHRQWKNRAPPSPRPAYGLERLAAHPEASVLFTEGEKSADAAQRLFPDFVAVTTMNGAKSPEKTDFTPFAGRKIFIARDNDEAGLGYQEKLIQLLRAAEAEVLGVLHLPLLERDGQPLEKGYDLADAEAAGWTAEALAGLGEALWLPVPIAAPAETHPEAEQTAPGPVKKAKPASPANKKKLGQEYAVDFANERHGGHVAAFSNQVLAYVDGYWKPLNPDVDIKKPLLSAMGIEATAARVNGVLDLIRIQYATEPELFERNSPLICLNNGTLNPMTGELLVHSPSNYLTNKLGIDFDRESTCPLWLQTLDEIFALDDDKAEKIQLLQEFIGFCLIPDTRLHQFLWLVGSGGNGKSLILAIITALIGKTNISYAQIERLQEKFVRAELQGKLVNISSEMSAQATIADGYLKQITSGDIIEAERKNEKPFSFKPYARLIGATNVLPRLLDHSDGFFRRAIIIRFNRQFTGAEKDNQREAKLMAELSGILNWALAGLQQLLARGEYLIPPSSEMEIRQYRVNSDPVRQFADEFLVVSEDKKFRVGSSELYGHYRTWSLDNGYKTLASNQFAERLLGVGIPRTRTSAGRFWEANSKWSDSVVPPEPQISSLAKLYSV